MAHSDNVTQEHLKSLFHYCESTGTFTRLVTASNNAKAGSVAGCMTSEGYLLIGIQNKLYKAHRLAWLYVHGEFPSGVIDHINMVRNDNRIANLRDCTCSQNNMNKEALSNNATKLRGVHFYKQRGKYTAQVGVNGKTNHLGYFATAEEAFSVADAYRKQHHGAFYRQPQGSGRRIGV